MANQEKVYQVKGLAEVGGFVDAASNALLNAVPSCRVNGSAEVGGFVWKAASAPVGTQVNSLENFVTNSGSGEPLGFVYRVQDVALPCGEGYTLAIPQGQPCPVASRGRFFAKSTTAAVDGQKVLANVNNGKITTGADAVSASAGTLNFKAVSAYSGWTSTTSGSLKLNIDGNEVALTGLNFGSVTSLADIAAVLDTALTNLADCAVNTETTGLIFTSKTTGANSSVAYVASASDIGTLLGASTASNVVATQGVDAQVDTKWVVKSNASVGNLFIIERA